MITLEGALKDMEVEKGKAQDTGSKAIIACLMVVVKMLSTMRSNQLLTENDKAKVQAAKEARKTNEIKK
jgi:hypothetical protein